MSNPSMQEIESKFWVASLPQIEQKLLALGAQLVEAREYEINYRFDTPQRELTKTRQVLRLRKTRKAILTYKTDGSLKDGAHVRREIEFEVSDLDQALAFLEALGYEMSVVYEKYRTTYLYNGIEIMLDEMPYGSFCELEGSDIEQLKALARQLHLTWQHSIPVSYLALFEQLKQHTGVAYTYLTFTEFLENPADPGLLGYQQADQG